MSACTEATGSPTDSRALQSRRSMDLKIDIGRGYLFHEYFHGDTGAGLGASHQTGWTGLLAKLIQQ